MGRIAILVVCAVAAGCSSTASELTAATQSTAVAYSENYQEIYRRVADGAKRCWSGVIKYSSFEVDSELYSELGFGEISFSLNNIGHRNYYFYAKIEKTAGGSVMTLNAGNTLQAATMKEHALRWASGDDRCQESSSAS